MTAPVTKAPIRPSASLIVVAPVTKKAQQDNVDYRVLMMKRNGRSSFLHAHVFPGGVVEAADQAINWTSDVKADPLLTHKVAAIRETFEESGLLLTHPPAHTVTGLDINSWRLRVHEDANQFKQLCDQHHLAPAVDRLTPFANWITPAAEKKRFDTQFFLTVLPTPLDDSQPSESTQASADGKETVSLDWFTPNEALALYREKKMVLFPPQWYTLDLMRQVPHYSDLEAKVGMGSVRVPTSGLPITIRPQFQLLGEPNELFPDEIQWKERGYNGYLCYPGDAKYQCDEAAVKQDLVPWSSHLVSPHHRHRLYFKGRLQEFTADKNIQLQEILPSHL
ncbi:hypothetical protein DM01DRAFT_1340649 [Hesseltinella vesiculosa]|uniref:Nudix hydrolase domain-containing protein n=1 Tax=Hesseltinella vesiculosa TaxID=101127 RepID=A0A1X2G3D2_9FUNG|nr:hypothetical protein DM01DRAFT_1340649 [Hesseltinella vesiculosa]